MNKYSKRRMYAAPYVPLPIMVLSSSMQYDKDGFKMAKSLRNPLLNSYGNNNHNYTPKEGYAKDLILTKNQVYAN